MKIRGLILDVDGTLGNTLPVCFAAFRRAFLEYTGRSFTDGEIEALFGPSEAGCIKLVLPQDWQEAYEVYLDEYQRVHDDIAPGPFPGLTEALRQLRAEGLRLAVVTGKGRESAEISLERMGLRELFDAVETGSLEGSIKEQMIRKLVTEWAISPEEAAYVGDAPSDIVIAKRAGVIPIAAAWADTSDPEALEEKQPAAVFRGVDEMMRWLRNGHGDTWSVR